MRIVFFGNHTVGVVALTSLLEVAEVVGVVAHPVDPEDGVCYQSVFDCARSMGIPVLRARGRDVAVHAFVLTAGPDLLWVTDYRYLLPSEVLGLARHGAVNLHPSLLPAYRGRAPLNWAILRGETEFGLTAHMIDDGMDSGDILVQERFTLAAHEDVADALERLTPLYAAMPRTIVAAIGRGLLTRIPQHHASATAFPARTPADGRIDWSRPATDIHNLVRAVSAPYPGAFAQRTTQRLSVWKTAIGDHSTRGIPGAVVDVQNGVPSIQCGAGTIQLLATSAPSQPWQRGDQLT